MIYRLYSISKLEKSAFAISFCYESVATGYSRILSQSTKSSKSSAAAIHYFLAYTSLLSTDTLQFAVTKPCLWYNPKSRDTISDELNY